MGTGALRPDVRAAQQLSVLGSVPPLVKAAASPGTVKPIKGGNGALSGVAVLAEACGDG